MTTTETTETSTREEEALLGLSPFVATLCKMLDPDGYQADLAAKREEHDTPE